MSDYKGYKLIDKIMLVCKVKDDDGTYQAYLVDPSNKSQLESARHWAKVTIYGRYDRGTQSYPDRVDYDPVEFTFDNEGFTFELLDYAKGSSQGGKLSFWNCIVRKQDNIFKIGINSELLLNLLREADFEKGVCKQNVRFASRNGKVGVVAEDSESLKTALNDMKTKAKVASSLTTRYNVGDNVTTLTYDDIYLGEAYYQYELKDFNNGYYRNINYSKDFILYKHKNPVKVYLFISRTTYNISKISDVFDSEKMWWRIQIEKTKKKRAIGSNPVKVDMTLQEMDFMMKDLNSNPAHVGDMNWYYSDNIDLTTLRYMMNSLFGIYLDPDQPYELSKEFQEHLDKTGVKTVEVE